MQTGILWGDVSVVIVTYNSAAVIGTCLARIGPAARIIVVDNASADDTVAVVRAAAPSARVIQFSQNQGFGTAVNRGMADVETPFALPLTPDALLAEDTLGWLAEALGDCPRAALAAPVLINGRGQIDLTVMGPSELHHVPADSMPEGAFCTWFVNGAACLWRMEAWRTVGGFDEKYFLYNEDADLCLRTARAGYALVVEPKAAAQHAGGRSAAPSAEVRRLKDWHQVWSNLYFSTKFGDAASVRRFGWRQMTRLAMKGLLYVVLLRWSRARSNFLKAGAAAAFLRGAPSH